MLATFEDVALQEPGARGEVAVPRNMGRVGVAVGTFLHKHAACVGGDG